jgi:3-hydroxy-9,10-secoandrosta-1,3,5(10)-triene-9,17-dione monooxygenase reductase component
MARIDPRGFRDALGHLPTGVTIVTARLPDVRVGLACNSVTSVSLEPPLVAFCAARSSTTWPQIRLAGRFCVNVLADCHAEAAQRFAKRGVDRFATSLSWHEREGGPGLDDAVAWVDCEAYDEHEAGDHVIVVGRVLALGMRSNASPLVFYRGAYGSFAETCGPTGL